MKFSHAVFGAGLLGTALADIDPIIVKGSNYIRGIAYQQDYSGNGTTDGSNTYIAPLSKPTLCKRDLPIFQELSTNTIRVYAIYPTADHKECMQMLADAASMLSPAASMLSPISSDPSRAIDCNDPSWQTTLYDRYTSVFDALAPYNNTLGFFADNEVSNSLNTTDASAFVKAAVRDMKAYIKEKGYRSGYLMILKLSGKS